MNTNDYIRQHKNTWYECWELLRDRESMVTAMVKAAYEAGMREQENLQYQAEQMEDAKWPEIYR